MEQRRRSWSPLSNHIPAFQVALQINNGSQNRAMEPKHRISVFKKRCPVNETDLKPGDHCFFWMNSGLYSHHGIYVGKELFIHLTATEKHGKPPSSCLHSGCGEHCPKSAVFKSCIKCFCEGKPLYRYEYGVGVHNLLHLRSTCTTATSDLCEEVIYRARWLLLHGVGNYNLLGLNCEDFAMFCKSGLICVCIPFMGASGQVNSVFRAPLVVFIAMKLTRPMPCAFLAVATALMIYQASRFALDLGFRFDAVKVKTKSSNIELSSLVRGDVIYWSTESAGLYMGKGFVILFALTERNGYLGGGEMERTAGMKLRCGTTTIPGMRLRCVECFTKRRPLYRYDYEAPYEIVPESGSPEVVEKRVLDLFFGRASCDSFNGSKDFVDYCKLGISSPDKRVTSGNAIMVDL